MFNIDLTATVNGTLQFGTTEIDIPVTYSFAAETETKGSPVTLAKDLGTTDSFVYTGFMGMKNGGAITSSLQYNALTKLNLTGGQALEIQFITWSNNSQQIKFANGVEFPLEQNTVPKVYERMVKERGVWFTIVMKDNAFSVYALDTANQWQQLTLRDGGGTSWNSGLDFANNAITSVEFYYSTDNQSTQAGAKLVGGKLTLGTSEPDLDAPVPAVMNSVLGSSVNIDDYGTYYWEHYSSANNGNNAATVTDYKEGAAANDCIEFLEPGSITTGGYETRPYTDWGGVVTGEAESGTLSSKGYVFYKRNELSATIQVSKNVHTISVLSATWIGNDSFTITLQGADGTIYAQEQFTPQNNGDIHITQFFLNTADWADEQVQELTLVMKCNDTLCLKGIAIS